VKRIATAVSTEVPSWFKFGEGSFLCREHEAQFRSPGAKMAHDDAEHPERVAARTVRTASASQMAAGTADLAKLTPRKATA
jgi:hypothetical protein